MTVYSYSQSFGTTVVSGNTPYGVYDTSPTFVTDCQKTAKWMVRKLGHPFVNIEIDDYQLYGSYEEAAIKHNSLITSHEATNWFLDYLGSILTTGSNLITKLPYYDWSYIKRLLEPTLAESELSSKVELKTGSFVMPAESQSYDLKAWAAASASTPEIDVRDVWHDPTPAMLKYYWPYSTFTNFEFFGSDYAGYSYAIGRYPMYMYPTFTNVLREQSIAALDKVRRSELSYEIHNNVIRLTPALTVDLTCWFTYYEIDPKKEYGNVYDSSSVATPSASEFMVTNIGNIPYREIPFDSLNSAALDWIRRFAFASLKEYLGHVRGKVHSIPIPGGEVTLDYDSLLAEAKEERDALMEELKARLELLTQESLMEKRANVQEQMNRHLKFVPFKNPVYIF